MIVRSMFDDIVSASSSIRAISRRLYEAGVLTPSGQKVWSSSTLGGLLRNRTYMGSAEWFRHGSVTGFV